MPSFLFPDEYQRMSISLDVVRALNSQAFFNEFTRNMLLQLKEGSMSHEKLAASLGVRMKSQRLTVRLNDLRSLGLIKEISGERKLSRRQYTLTEHCKEFFIPHLNERNFKFWPDPVQYMLLEFFLKSRSRRSFDVISLLLQHPLASKSQLRRLLDSFVGNGWLKKERRFIRGRMKTQYHVNVPVVEELLQAIHERSDNLKNIDRSINLANLTIKITDRLLFFLNNRRFLHLATLTWLSSMKGRQPFVLDLQRVLFVSRSRINIILDDLGNLSLLDTYESDRVKKRRIILNLKSIDEFLTSLDRL